MMGCGSGGGTGVDGEAPAAPSGVQATSQDGAVALSWDEVEGASGYNVYRDTISTSDVSGSPINGEPLIEQPSFTDEGVENGTRYYYRVTAVGEGNESGLSVEVSARPFPNPPDRP
jgi:fibronectin type 3 domain-containing protein